MQRQTGSRIRPLPVPGTPPIVPDATKDKADNAKSIERSRASPVNQHPAD
jgi:hypothetical protein